ncbi:hypothetical protein CSV76_11975 [Sporosarcina sp. P17b]|nr:hypothetical protein SporoP32a_04515 [Sporosarcina ureae]PIC73053.1 hypothetical protein CSV76_11975 [Sporosarcina sp. P17b]
MIVIVVILLFFSIANKGVWILVWRDNNEKLAECWGGDLRFGGDAFWRAGGEPHPFASLAGCFTCPADPPRVAPPTLQSLAM